MCVSRKDILFISKGYYMLERRILCRSEGWCLVCRSCHCKRLLVAGMYWECDDDDDGYVLVVVIQLPSDGNRGDDAILVVVVVVVCLRSFLHFPFQPRSLWCYKEKMESVTPSTICEVVLHVLLLMEQ